MPFNAITGSRRGSKVFTSGDGYYYSYRREKNLKSHYQCYKQSCEASVWVLKGEDVETVNDRFPNHCHPPEPLLGAEFHLRERILNRVEHESLPIKKIFDEECNR